MYNKATCSEKFVDAVSRRVLMVALANVQSLLIKVADSVLQYSYRSVTSSAVD